MRAAEDGADDLDILVPRSKTLIVDGQQVYFNEYGFYSGLLVRGCAKDFIHDLSAALMCPDSELLLRIEDSFEKHASALIDCVALSCDKPREWIIALNEKDGRAVDGAWWEVNGPFFVRCAKRKLYSALITKEVVDGQMYGQPSLPTATTQSELVATPIAK